MRSNCCSRAEAGDLQLNARAVFTARCARLRELLAQTTARATTRSRPCSGGLCAAKSSSASRSRCQASGTAALRRRAGAHRSSYAQYLGLTRTLRLAQPRFMEQFKRMLLSRSCAWSSSRRAARSRWNRAAVADQRPGRRTPAVFQRRAAAIEAASWWPPANFEQRLAELAARTALQHVLQRLGTSSSPCVTRRRRVHRRRRDDGAGRRPALSLGLRSRQAAAPTGLPRREWARASTISSATSDRPTASGEGEVDGPVASGAAIHSCASRRDGPRRARSGRCRSAIR